MAERLQFYGTGRRKTSVARVFLRAGPGEITVNKRTTSRARACGSWSRSRSS